MYNFKKLLLPLQSKYNENLMGMKRITGLMIVLLTAMTAVAQETKKSVYL